MVLGMLAVSTSLLVTLTRPATCGQEYEPLLVVHPCCVEVAELDNGANRVCRRTPEVAVELLEMMVLLMMLVASASNRDTPPPSMPATLLAMMLLVIWMAFQGISAWNGGTPEWLGRVGQFTAAGCGLRPPVVGFPLGKLITSVPLMFCSLNPPPLPLSAELPRIRLALMVRPGPAPSLGVMVLAGEMQSWSLVAHGGSGSGAPMMSKPPPLVTMVGLVVWLKRMVLCSMSP